MCWCWIGGYKRAKGGGFVIRLIPYLVLFLGDLNLLLIFFLIGMGGLLVNTNTALHLLLTAELLWITLYSIVLFVGLVYDNINLLSLTFFFLIFSAIEFGVGLVILLLQHILLRTLGLHTSDINILKYTNRYNRSINLNRLNFDLKL
jgi:NADH:ubiquinone oxidoreductase subunit K